MEIDLDEFKDPSSGHTLEQLRQLQLDKGLDPAGQSQQPSPLPYASNRSKEAIFQPGSFGHIADTVSSLLPTVDDDWQTFTDRLIRECRCSTVLDKVRAAFEWVGRADPAAASGMGADQRKRDSPLDILIRCRQEKLFSALFQRLIAYAGIEYELIRGYKKGTSYRIGEKIDEVRDRGLWFGVLIDGEWRLIDAHWGCCHVAGENSGEWNRINDDGRVQKAQPSRGTMVYSCNETYFLTDPWKMIFKHYPERPEWQLLPQPLTKREFEQLPYMFPDLMESFGLRLVSHLKAVALVPESGELVLQFEETGPSLKEYAALLYIHTGSLSTNSDTVDFQRRKMKLTRFAALKRRDKQLEVAVYPPQTGKYLLVLQGVNSGDESPGATATRVDLIHYVLHCDRIGDDVAPLPETRADEWGLGARAEKIGVTAVNHRGAEIRLTDGEETLQLKANSELDYRCELRNREDPNPLEDNEPLVWRQGELDMVHVVAPESGKFGLSIMARRRGDESDESYQLVGDFLVEADVAAVENGEVGVNSVPPARLLGGRLGASSAEATAAAESLSAHPAVMDETNEDYSRPYVRTDQAEVGLIWRHPEATRLRGELLHYSQGQLEALPNFCLVQTSPDGSGTEFRVRLRDNGSHVLRIFGSGPDHSEEQLLFTYLIRSRGTIDPQQAAVPFPTMGEAWGPSFRLLEGLQGLLKPGSQAKLSLHVGNSSTVQSVFLRRIKSTGENDSREPLLTLEAGPDGCLSGQIPTDSAGDEYSVVCRYSDGAEACLLIYAVSASEIEEKRKEEEEEPSHDEKKEKSSRVSLRGSENLPPNSPKQQTEAAARSHSQSRSRSASRSRSRSPSRSRSASRSRSRSRSPAKSGMKSRSRSRSRSRSQSRSRSPSTSRSRSRSRSGSRSSSSDSSHRASTSGRGRSSVGATVTSSKADEKQRRRAEAKERRAIKKHCRIQLCEALRQRRPKPIKAAIDEWVGKGQSQDDELYAFAKRFLRMLQLKDKLNNSIEQAKANRNKERIAEVLREIDDEFFSEEILAELSADMRRAQDVYKRFDRIEKITIKPLNLDEKSKLELSCYANPDQDIHATVIAVLLIMGFYEKRTRKWKRCQPIVKTLRVADFNRLDPASVHPAIAARCKEILANLDIREVALKSAAAAAFFDWTKNVVAAVGELSGDSDAQPASIRQQKKILKVSAEEDADLDWEDKGKRVQTGQRGRKTPKA